MSNFHNALQQIVKATSLTIAVEKNVHDCGTVGVKASLKPIKDSGFTSTILTVDFVVVNEQARVTAQMEKFSLNSTSSDLELKIKQRQDAFEIATTLINSEEIKQLLIELAKEEETKAKVKYNQKIEKMQKTHTQLTEQDATELLEKAVAEVRKVHGEKNANHKGRYPIDCKISFSALTIHENCKTDNVYLQIALSKRIAYNANNWSKTKQETIEALTGTWIVNNLELSVQ
ncbi:hypothetical protein OTK49_21405 [Vibrio coralliirubri]|uniref:hypothetical protein n=1 Tax=Vibrio coralliirubri TaxID=1516159 RepID=UPI0022839943|nr:hypothetical protein [Vibrio coralliirubri]MCY9865079.1 hypothetical protein [Vibrio coralliirubri]